MRVKTLCSESLFVHQMLKLCVPSMISIKDMSIGYGHVCDEHNGRYKSIKSPRGAILYQRREYLI
jgi:hypothetical protein